MPYKPPHPHNSRQVVAIDVLPDDVLLAIFDFYVVQYHLYLLEATFGNQEMRTNIESWQSLAHVCRRWRGLVFESPRRLNLQLCYKPGTSARMSLDVWPPLPLVIHGDVYETSVDNVIAKLEHRDRICQMNLRCFTTSRIEKLWTAMQVPFPELAVLRLAARDLSYVPVLPDSFLGGSAPRLRHFYLYGTPFPGLPKLLLSVTNLVNLWLLNIPHSGYFSPKAMATCLSMLTSLDTLQLEFESPQSCPDHESRYSPSPTRSVLPALTSFCFKGANEYLEELVARVDTPQLFLLSVTFFNDIDFDTRELIRLVRHLSTLKAPNEAHIVFDSRTASVKLQPQASDTEYFQVNISCREPNWQLSSLAQICNTSLPLLSTTENLFICEPAGLLLDWKGGIENIEWLELLLPFVAVKNLYLSKRFAPRIAPALQEMTGGGTIEVLSALQDLYLEGFRPSESVQEGIERFISSRRVTNHFVTISVWKREEEIPEVKPSLKAKLMPRAASAPSTPFYNPKGVRFNSNLEEVKLFIGEKRPRVVSRDDSPTTTSGTDSEFPPFIYARGNGLEERPLVMHRIDVPIAPPLATETGDAVVENIDLVGTTVEGIVRVRNIAFEKWIAVRFTLDKWQTTSEITARYKESIPNSAFDRFMFSIKLADFLFRADKTLFFAVRYLVAGREIWDNNSGRNYQVWLVPEKKH